MMFPLLTTAIFAMTSSSTVNLATREYDAVALASSMKDTGANYTDHLIDGSDQTIWHSGSSATQEWPHWIEIRWKHEQQPSGVRLAAAKSHSVPERWRVEQWAAGEWREVAKVANGASEVAFAAVKTEKLRIRFEGEIPAFALREVQVEGKGWRISERMRPYWTGSYIWHAEKDQLLVRNAPRYFRRSFHIESVSDISAAYLVSRSNDSYVAFINGQEVASGSTTITPLNVRTHLRDGENVLAYVATAQSSPGWGKMELIGDLILYTLEGREVIGTDESWVSAEVEFPKWHEPGFRLGSEWRAAAVIGAPPGDPWGEISYPDPGVPITVALEELVITPKEAKPGDEVTLRAILKTRQPIAFPFQFEWRIGDQLMRPDLGNFAVTSGFTLPSPQVNEWESGKPYTVEGKVRLPAWTPNGRVPVQITATSTDGMNRQLRMNGAAASEPLGFLAVNRERANEEAGGTGAAKGVRNGLLAAFEIDGKRVPPVFFGGAMHKNYRAYDAFSRSGSIVSIHMPGRMSTSEKHLENGMRIFDQQARHLLNLVPDAKIVLAAHLRPTAEWLAANPDGLLKDAFGKTYGESIASERYRADARKFVEQIAKAVKELPYAHQVIGFHFVMGAQSDAYIGGVERNIGEMSRDQWTLGDWNETAVEDFRRFLQERYRGDIAALRTAWIDESLTFETAIAKRELLVGTLKDHSLFRNPKEEGMMGPDYCAWISSIIPRVYDEVAVRTLKKHFREETLVFNWSGYLVQLLASIPPGSLQQNNGFWLQHTNYTADSGSIFTGTTNYTTRHAGFRATPFQPLDSYAVNDRIGMIEIDYRTFVSGPKIHGRQLRQDETIAVLRREMGSALIHGSGYYFLEFTGTGNGRAGVGYLDHESIQQTLETSHAELARAIDENRAPTGNAEIAVVVSAETPWYQDVAYPAVLTHTMVNRMLYRNLAAIGAPVDTLEVNDLNDLKRMERYKLILFTNTWYLSDAQRETIERLKGGGRTLCWFYAPGYVHDRDGLSVEASSMLTGIKLQTIEGREEPAFQTLGADHPLLRDVRPGTRVALDAFGAGNGFNELMPTRIYPNFEVVDEAAMVVGRDQNQRARLVVKEMEGWRSVYSAVPDMTAQMLRNLVTLAGVHCYTEPGVVVEANSGYLLLHSHRDEEREIEVALPRSSTVKSVYHDTTWDASPTFRVRLPKGSFTDLYELNQP